MKEFNQMVHQAQPSHEDLKNKQSKLQFLHGQRSLLCFSNLGLFVLYLYSTCLIKH